MMMFQDLIYGRKWLILYLVFPWLITEIIETAIYIIKPQKEYKPSVNDSFCWIWGIQ
jgi:hypothetical protein